MQKYNNEDLKVIHLAFEEQFFYIISYTEIECILSYEKSSLVKELLERFILLIKYTFWQRN